MLQGKKIVVVLPAYNAARTLEKVVSEIPFGIVDEAILTDDASTDATVALAGRLNIHHILPHETNKGYGANQKTCYAKALEIGADIVIMLHPDYQYSPKLIPSMAELIVSDSFDVVLGSRILGSGALKGGMPFYKYAANRILTFFQNVMADAKLSEYHTGYRAFSAAVLRTIDWKTNADGFVFDNEILSQIIYAGFRVGEISSPARYFEEASSINFPRSVAYGLGVVRVSIVHRLNSMGLLRSNGYKKINR